MDLPVTNMLALVVPLPEISRFSMPEPFKGKQFTTWALIHGTTLEAAQNILLEGFIRPGNWSFNHDYSKSDVPTFWCLLHGLGDRPWRQNPWLGCTKADGSLSKTGKRPTKGAHRSLVSWCWQSCQLQRRRKWNGSSTCRKLRHRHRVREVHNCPQQSRRASVLRLEVDKPTCRRWRWWRHLQWCQLQGQTTATVWAQRGTSRHGSEFWICQTLRWLRYFTHRCQTGKLICF